MGRHAGRRGGTGQRIRPPDKEEIHGVGPERPVRHRPHIEYHRPGVPGRRGIPSRPEIMTASEDTTIGEADAALRSESALLDERLPVRWDGEIIHWTDRWTDIGDMLFLCGNNRLRTLQACPGTDSRRRWNQHRPHLWKPWSITGRTTRSRLCLMRCGVCGLTIVEEDPFDGSEEKTWQLDEPDYGPDGSHAIIQGELDI